MTELAASPTKYSGNATGANTAVTGKDLCEPTANTGKSFGILDGGFSILLAGDAFGGQSFVYGSFGYFWSASSRDALNAWYRYLKSGGVAVGQDYTLHYVLFSVRCKKN